MIQSVSSPVFFGIVVFVLVLAGVAGYAGLYARRRVALIAGTRMSRIRTAVEGYCKVEGSIELIDGSTLTSPLTLSPCCWYHARIEKWQTSGKSAHWETVWDDTSTAPFLLRDASGVCIVIPDSAEVTPTDKSQWLGATEEPTDRNPPRVGPVESTKGIIEIAGGPNSRFRYSEERIYAGDPLLALGYFQTEHRVEDPDEDEGNDDFDVAEDLGVSTSAALEVIHQSDELTTQAMAITSRSISIGPHTHPFILTTTPEATHVARFQTGGRAALVIAVVLLGFALYLFWSRFV